MSGRFGACCLLAGLIVGNGPVEKEQRREWLIKQKAKGLEPNSIAGVQMRGGYPIINTILMMQDIARTTLNCVFQQIRPAESGRSDHWHLCWVTWKEVLPLGRSSS